MCRCIQLCYIALNNPNNCFFAWIKQLICLKTDKDIFQVKIYTFFAHLKENRFLLYIVNGCLSFIALLMYLLGNLEVFTTAEIVLGECVDLVFNRTFDSRNYS